MGEMSELPTTIVLKTWDQQSTTAERLCADILRLNGFEDVDPQQPRGGKDGGKDILCSKDGVTFVAACHFPHDPVTFAKTKKKFSDDLAASMKQGRDGFIFMTNQHLSPTERTALETLAGAAKKRALVMHREYLRVALDSPQGYGIRFRHLRISMTPEEQFAYFASTRNSVADAIAENTQAIARLAAKIDRGAATQIDLFRQTTAVILDAVAGADPDEVTAVLDKSINDASQSLFFGRANALSAQMSTALIRYVHRKVVTTSVHHYGKYRQTQVWLADPTGTIAEDIECPPWDEVPGRMDALVADWVRGYDALVIADEIKRVEAIADFMHRLLAIHPFIDGNGRVARDLASLQARDLFGLSEDLLIEKGAPYYLALRQADNGDLSALTSLLRRAVTGAA
jgi:fido (protein-threonine AMPylation protein)